MADPAGYTVNPDPATAAPDQQPQAAYPPQDVAYPPQQQQGYPPQQQQGYPPQQQQGYPPQQQQGYPPQQQQGYPPQQQQGYPPQQQQGYPPQGYGEKQAIPQQQAYPQQGYAGGAPPPYTQGPPQVQQQTGTSVVVVQQQPAVVVAHPVRQYGAGDHGLIYAIIASVCIFFVGAWCSLFCTIPAIFISINAQDAERRGDTATMRSQAQTSVILTSVGIFFSVGAWIAYILFIVLV